MFDEQFWNDYLKLFVGMQLPENVCHINRNTLIIFIGEFVQMRFENSHKVIGRFFKNKTSFLNWYLHYNNNKISRHVRVSTTGSSSLCVSMLSSLFDSDFLFDIWISSNHWSKRLILKCKILIRCKRNNIWKV